MRRRHFLALVASVTLTTALLAPADTHAAATRSDATPRIAIISAFEPELTTLLANVKQKKTYRANGVEFTTGTLRGKRVVLFLSGISMVNASMNTQLALERFRVTHIAFSGIAGGVNPALNIGDVVVAERWVVS
jgi:adenosylhomocysteine nucleosidase